MHISCHTSFCSAGKQPENTTEMPQTVYRPAAAARQQQRPCHVNARRSNNLHAQASTWRAALLPSRRDRRFTYVRNR